MPSALTLEEVVRRAGKVHNGRYSFTKTKYKDAKTKVVASCKEHGEFWLLPHNLMKGVGCPECADIARSSSQAMSQETFIARAQLAQLGRGYDFSPTQYKRSVDKVTVLCPVHGAFEVRASNLLLGVGCGKCGRLDVGRSMLKSQEQFIQEAVAIHGPTYGYGSVEYKGVFEYVEIECLKPGHGTFRQTPDAHLNSGAGCPVCTHRYSAPHKEIEAFLALHGVPYRSNDRTAIRPYELDIYLPEHNLAIEFNGRYWHSLDGSESPATKYKHRDKFLACRERGIRLLQIDEHEWNNEVTQAVWKSVLLSKLGKHTRIFARTTEFRAIERDAARAFLEVNHLQGGTPAARWCFGLFHGSELVGVITFAGHEKVYLNLTRLAFLSGLTVVGGAQKLFKNAVAHLPAKSIVTFSSNNYSGGDVYGKLGFVKDADLPPSYQWLFRGKVWNKRRLRRSKLATLLGPGFNPLETEHQNLYRVGARCLYDAGYQKWIMHRAV